MLYPKDLDEELLDPCASGMYGILVHIFLEQGLWLIQSSAHAKMTSVHLNFYGVLAHCTCSCMQSYFLVTHPRPPPAHFLDDDDDDKKQHQSAVKN